MLQPAAKAQTMSGWEWPDTPITYVVDGDTFDAMVARDLGFNGKAIFPVRLRLHRVNTPPKNSVTGRIATARVAELTAAPVFVLTLKPYKYGGPAHTVGEWMAEVVLPSGDNLSDLLVREELAVYWDGTGPRPELRRLVERSDG
jgi:endonuclease YncB( thermonuclease family)